ncbi:chromo domain-containing protein [Thermococcus stetteri]|uniref:hypothetical protein n=1 Tax=Thermococcus stetteri TaxID=49900 RepID=UPI001AE291E1|nr:hypothetical protein [Thermococcus stetteri]MBP1913000.1 hypothetical protein [Thermococcus stetteri]
MKGNRQLVGNIGLFYVCYELSKRGWNCLPTIRNAKGVDIVIYSQDGSRKYTIQVKSLSGRNAVPLSGGITVDFDFLIICRNVLDSPELFILTLEEVKREMNKRVNKKGEVSYWIEYKDYEKYKDAWDKIGEGF